MKRLKMKGRKPLKNLGTIFTTIFDDVTNSHEITKNIISRSAKFKDSMIHKSLASSAARICPKRKILKKIVKFYQNSL